jgi:hypothetical protein
MFPWLLRRRFRRSFGNCLPPDALAQVLDDLPKNEWPAFRRWLSEGFRKMRLLLFLRQPNVFPTPLSQKELEACRKIGSMASQVLGQVDGREKPPERRGP